MCYSLLSAGTCCLRYNMSPAKKEETDFYSQCFSVVWIILLTTKKQLLQYQVLLPVVQKDPDIPKSMSVGQKDIPELPGVSFGTSAPETWGICTMEPRAPSTDLKPGLPEFSSTLLHCLVLFCWDPESAAARYGSLRLWRRDNGSWDIHHSKPLKWIRIPLHYSGEMGKEANLSEELPINGSCLLSVTPSWRRK